MEQHQADIKKIQQKITNAFKQIVRHNVYSVDESDNDESGQPETKPYSVNNDTYQEKEEKDDSNLVFCQSNQYEQEEESHKVNGSFYKKSVHKQKEPLQKQQMNHFGAKKYKKASKLRDTKSQVFSKSYDQNLSQSDKQDKSQLLFEEQSSVFQKKITKQKHESKHKKEMFKIAQENIEKDQKNKKQDKKIQNMWEKMRKTDFQIVINTNKHKKWISEIQASQNKKKSSKNDQINKKDFSPKKISKPQPKKIQQKIIIQTKKATKAQKSKPKIQQPKQLISNKKTIQVKKNKKNDDKQLTIDDKQLTPLRIAICIFQTPPPNSNTQQSNKKNSIANTAINIDKKKISKENATSRQEKSSFDDKISYHKQVISDAGESQTKSKRVQSIPQTINVSAQTFKQNNPKSKSNDEVQQIDIIDNTPIKTGKASLVKLVGQLFKNKIINESLYQNFKENHSQSDIQDFLLKFRTGRLHRFDYAKIKFTLLDHRRIADILAYLIPDKYTVTQPSSLIPGTQDFLSKLYDMTAQDYYQLYTKIDKISGIKWWSKLLIQNDEQLTARNKEKRRAQRRADRAMEALQAEMQQAKKGPLRSQNPSQPPAKNYYEIQLAGQQQKDKVSQAEIQKNQQQLKRKRQKDSQQLIRIRNLVSSLGNKQTAPSETGQARKKIKLNE